MRTPDTREQHDRDDLRYPSDLSDDEWRVLAPLLPPPARTGRKRSWTMRETMNAIFYVLRGGCPWRMLPEHFPPHQTAYRWFTRFRDDGTWERLDHQLVAQDRQRAGRNAGPTAAVIDTQSVKTTEAGGPRGYDAGKKINGRKRHALADTDGRSLELQVHPASVQDRDGARQRYKPPTPGSHQSRRCLPTAPMPASASPTRHPSWWRLSASCPIRLASSCFRAAGSSNGSLPGSIVPPPAKDFEATIASATAFLHAACVMLLARRLARWT